MKTKNTPGPWKWIGTIGRPSGLHYLRGPDYATVGACLGSDFTDNPADARLIAAAPDLLSALKEYVDRHEAGCNAEGLPEYERAVAAITKATT